MVVIFIILLNNFRFEVKICKRDGLQCSHCKSEIVSRQQISQCQECRVSTHVTCSHELLPDCTPMKKEKETITPILSDNKKNTEIESWVTIWE